MLLLFTIEIRKRRGSVLSHKRFGGQEHPIEINATEKMQFDKSKLERRGHNMIQDVSDIIHRNQGHKAVKRARGMLRRWWKIYELYAYDPMLDWTNGMC